MEYWEIGILIFLEYWYLGILRYWNIDIFQCWNWIIEILEYWNIGISEYLQTINKYVQESHLYVTSTSRWGKVKNKIDKTETNKIALYSNIVTMQDFIFVATLNGSNQARLFSHLFPFINSTPLSYA